MAQKNRANMLTDIVTNIFNNIINYITGQNAQDRFVNLLDSTPNILSDKDQADGYVGTDVNNEMVSTYYNENDSRANIITMMGLGELVGSKFYQVNDADGGTRTLQVCAENALILHNFAIDVQTGETGDYDINTDVFTPIVVSGTPTLSQVLTAGNTSGANDIEFDATQGLLFSNTSRLREGTIDAGLGGAKGIAQICAVGYELKWEAGRLYVMDGNGLTIRLSLYNFANAPTITDDSTKGYVAGSRWILDDGTIYTCLNAATGAAIWVQESSVPNLQQVTDSDNTTTNPIVVNAGGGDKIEVSDTSIKITNVLGGVAVIQSQSLNSTTFFELPDKATSQTFAMLEDVTGDVVGPASAVDNNIATFDGTTGKLIQDGGTTIADINTNAVDRITVKLAESITKGQAVYISGANGTNILVSKASNLTEATSSKTLGLLETTGATNAIVNVITSGLIDGINTSAATIGDAVWLGTAGNLLFGLANKPYAPAHLVYIGVVSRVSATVGEIIVKVQNGFELKEIHDVFAQTPVAKDGLFYDSTTSLWKARQVTATDIDANVSNTEFGYLDGVTSAIQTQINGKQATLTNPVTGTGTNNQIAAFNSTGSTITSLSVATYPSLTELSYVKGVTSALKAPISSVGNGTAVTGVVVNTYSKGLLIPANSRVAGDVPQIDCQVAKTGTAGNIQLRFYWNTTNDLAGSPILIGTSANGAANWTAMSRLMCIEVAAGGGNGTKVAPTTVVLATGWGTATAAPNALAIDWTANGYLICAILNSNAGDSSVCHMLKLN